jgi:phosphoribosylglycinamide formyltransferase-1
MNTTPPILTLGILGSGRGSNMQSIQSAIAAGSIPAKIGCVISDVEDAFILERARHVHLPAHFVDMAPFRTKMDGAAEAKVIELLQQHQVDLVVLAGFMRIVKPGLLQAFPHRVLNIHPSLLPSFPGLNAWEQARAYGVKFTGCTVHFVDDGTDTGPIILQRTVPVFDRDTDESLHARIQEQEHNAYPEAIRLVARGLLKIDGRRVIRHTAEA